LIFDPEDGNSTVFRNIYKLPEYAATSQKTVLFILTNLFLLYCVNVRSKPELQNQRRPLLGNGSVNMFPWDPNHVRAATTDELLEMFSVGSVAEALRVVARNYVAL
jgi:hypothetical protein